MKVSENVYEVLQLPPSTPVIGQHLTNLFSPNDQPLLVAFMLNANLALNVDSPASNQVPNSSLSSEDNESTVASRGTVGFYASLRYAGGRLWVRMVSTLGVPFRRGSLTQSRTEEPKYVHCRLVCKTIPNVDPENTENGEQPVLLSVAALPLPVLIGEYSGPR